MMYFPGTHREDKNTLRRKKNHETITKVITLVTKKILIHFREAQYLIKIIKLEG